MYFFNPVSLENFLEGLEVAQITPTLLVCLNREMCLLLEISVLQYDLLIVHMIGGIKQ